MTLEGIQFDNLVEWLDLFGAGKQSRATCDPVLDPRLCKWVDEDRSHKGQQTLNLTSQYVRWIGMHMYAHISVK